MSQKRTVPGPPLFGSSGTNLRSRVPLGRPRLSWNSPHAMWLGTGPSQPCELGTILDRHPYPDGVVLDRCLSRALASTLVSSRLILLSSPAQFARPGKLGLAQERLSDLPLVVESLRCDMFNDGTDCLAAPTLEVLLGKRFSHFRHKGGVRTPVAPRGGSCLDN
jgi:hypothetical protein